AAGEDDCETKARSDPRVVPVDARSGDGAGGGVRLSEAAGDLRLADRAGLRADELDLVARAAARECPDDLDLIAAVDRVIHRRGAMHAEGLGDVGRAVPWGIAV